MSVATFNLHDGFRANNRAMFSGRVDQQRLMTAPSKKQIAVVSIAPDRYNIAFGQNERNLVGMGKMRVFQPGEKW